MMSPMLKPDKTAVPKLQERLIPSDQETVMLRYEFYRDGFRRMAKGTIALALCLVISIAANVFLATRQVKPVYFALTTDGRLIPMPAMSEPVWTDAQILNWAATAASESYTYNFQTYQRDFQRAAYNYTTKGWERFTAALEKTRNLEAVIGRKISVRAVAQSATIVDKGIDPVNGVYYWRIQVPMSITYESLSERTVSAGSARLTIVRRSPLEHERGIGIDVLHLS
jgi:intracellular multiplication protein IcmL